MIDAWWAWLRRWRPCVPKETAGGLTAAELSEQLQEARKRIADQERLANEFKRQVDDAVRRNDNLEDLLRDIRELTKREGV